MQKKTNSTIQFQLPQKDVFKPCNESDPLVYYYKPFIGKMYRQRIQSGLNLLTQDHYPNIMEFGYGNGLLIPTLAKMGDVTGVDLFTQPDSLIKTLLDLNVHANLYIGDILNMEFKEKKFNLIVAMSVFEHIREFQLVLDKMYDLLSNGGQILIGMPRVDFFMDYLFKLIGYNNINDHHITDFKKIIEYSKRNFTLKKINRYPINFQLFPALYYNFLLEKR